MKVSFTDEQLRFIAQQIERGRYQNAAEVIRDGLRRLMDEDEARTVQLDELRQQVAEGFSSAKAGRLRDGAEVVAELQQFLGRRRRTSR